MAVKLDTTINPDDPAIYQAIGSVHDPRTDEGMEEDPVEDRPNQVRIRAMQFAQKWARQGYWGSVYNQRTGECVIDYAPKGLDRSASTDS